MHVHVCVHVRVCVHVHGVTITYLHTLIFIILQEYIL